MRETKARKSHSHLQSECYVNEKFRESLWTSERAIYFQNFSLFSCFNETGDTVV